jgi:hypothetical protein
VATMDFVRTRLGVPVPKVLAWGANISSWKNVCAIYLQAGWRQPKIPATTSLILPSCRAIWPTSRSRSMGVYYKDVDPFLQARPLYANGERQDGCSARIRFGPIIERRVYLIKASELVCLLIVDHVGSSHSSY